MNKSKSNKYYNNAIHAIYLQKTIEKRRARAKRFSLPEISFEQDQTDAQHREDLLKTYLYI